MKKIELTRGYKAIVDDEDFEELKRHKWSCQLISGRYLHATRNIERNANAQGTHTEYMSRRIMRASNDVIIDHINHNTLDNRKCNLRGCSKSQNAMNLRKTSNRKTSKYKGVYFRKDYGKWQAKIMLDYKNYYLGCFKTALGAAIMYNMAARKYFGEFAQCNSVPQKDSSICQLAQAI